MEKMRMESVDTTAQNIDKIGAMFPNCITETVDENGNPKKAINFELLKQMLSSDVLEGDEAYEFTVHQDQEAHKSRSFEKKQKNETILSW